MPNPYTTQPARAGAQRNDPAIFDGLHILAAQIEPHEQPWVEAWGRFLGIPTAARSRLWSTPAPG